MADALRELWGSAGLRRRTVAVGLASQRVTVRQIDLPDLPESDLADAIRLQAQDQLPIPVDEALLDHIVVERYALGDERHNVRVLLVAAEREMVDRLLAAVTGAKLRPALVDLEAFALVRSLATGPTNGDRATGDDASPGGDGPTGGGQVELIVDIGAMVTKIAVHRAGHPLFVRMVRLGGDAATSELQKVLDLSWEEAERAKLDASVAIAAGTELDPDDERARVLSEQRATRRHRGPGLIGLLPQPARGHRRAEGVARRRSHPGTGPRRPAAGGARAPGRGRRPAPKLSTEWTSRMTSQRRRQFLAVPVGLAMGLLL